MNASPGSWTARRRPVRAIDATRDRGSNGPKFARFAAAMEAAPPPEAQVLPETLAATDIAATAAGPGGATWAPIRPGIKPAPAPTVVSQAAVPPAAVAQEAAPMPAEPPDDDPIPDDGPYPDDGPAGGMSTVTPRRPVIDGRLRGAIPWLGIGSWVLFCGALFVSLLGWPDQIALDRVVGLWSGNPHESVATRTPEVAPQAGPTGVEPHQIPGEEDWSSMTPGTEHPETPPAEVAPDAGPRAVREPGGPPVPQFKPRIDGVAAKFSSAFYEIGNQLQRQGDFDAALHMRRQGNNLDPWRVSIARES